MKKRIKKKVSKKVSKPKLTQVMKKELLIDKKFQKTQPTKQLPTIPQKTIHPPQKKPGFFARLFGLGKPKKEKTQSLQEHTPKVKKILKQDFSKEMKQELKLDKRLEKEFEKANIKAVTLSKKILQDKSHKLCKDKEIQERETERKRNLGEGHNGYLSTGIIGFDSHFEKNQGIPKGASILIEGGPGSGKTILGLTAINNLCKQGKKCLYMSFEEPEEQLISHMENFGFNPKEYIKKGLLKVKRFDAIDVSRSIEALLSAAKKELLIDVNPVFFPRDFQADFVVIDSLTSISSAFTGKENRFRIYMEQLFRYLENNNITSFLIREVSTPSHFGSNYKEEGAAVSFLSDGIVALYNVIYSTGKRGGAIEILKMRGVNFKKQIVEMEITSKGVQVYPNKIMSEGKGKRFRFT